MIIVRLDVVMALQKMKGKDLAAELEITEANLSKLKTGNIKAVRLSTLNHLCRILNCQPGDLFEYVDDA
jgi:putative transcriptional regulator